jgi:hypothetical protein
MDWKDVTSYSRGEERVPSAWEAKADELRIVVTRKHIHAPGHWVMHCEPWFTTRPIGPDMLSNEDAQSKAEEMVRAKVAATARALGMR